MIRRLSNLPLYLREYGLLTYTSSHLAHLFPLVRRVWWYERQECIDYANRNSLPEILNKRKTGTGLLIPKNAPFLKMVITPIEIVGDTETWKNLTDRERGLRGEPIVRQLIKAGLINVPPISAQELRTKQAQFSGKDIAVIPATFEVKTETVQSGNLFVQLREGKHDVHRLPDGSRRVTAAPWESAA